MTNLQRHHELALKILVARALAVKGKGLPWSADEDREMIIRERLLWASLTPDEQAVEQRFLADFWGSRGHSRTINLSPEIGPVEIPDAAFGLPTDHFRPWGRGIEVLVREHPRLKPILTLLWNAGFQPASILDDGVTLPIPAARVTQETDRLTGLIARTFPSIRVVPATSSEGGARIQATYDAATGQAVIHLSGLSELGAFISG